MNTTLRRGALAFALLGGVALISAPAQAGSLQDEGDFGGSWARIGPSVHYHHRYPDRYYGSPIYVAPSYAYGPDYYEPDYYGPPAYYDYGPGIALIAPGIGVAIGID
jgi:hypothetical protein